MCHYSQVTGLGGTVHSRCPAALGAAPEDGVAGAISCKVHQRAKGVPRPPVVHVAHDGAQVRKLRLLHQVPHCRRGRRTGGQQGWVGCTPPRSPPRDSAASRRRRRQATAYKCN